MKKVPVFDNYVLLIAFVNVITAILPVSCYHANRIAQNKHQGEIQIDVFLFDSISKDFTKRLSPTVEMLVFNEYIVETCKGIKQVAINNEEVSNYGYINGYFFINTVKKTCAEYNSFSLGSEKVKTYPLIEKKIGFRFEDGEDYFNENMVLAVADTVVYEKSYKKIVADIESHEHEPSSRVTAYIDTNIHFVPLYLSKFLAGKFIGFIERLDIEYTGTNQKISYQMNFKESKLPDSAYAIIKKWAGN